MAFVPDDRAEAVLEHARARLAVANHYVDRKRWIALGLAVARARVPVEQAARFRALAAAQIALTGIDGDGKERLAAWDPDEQRTIVLARLSQHQRQFLPRQLVEPWLRALAGSLPPGTWKDGGDPGDPADARRALDDGATATAAWPTREQVISVFTLLGRCAGEAAVMECLTALNESALAPAQWRGESRSVI